MTDDTAVNIEPERFDKAIWSNNGKYTMTASMTEMQFTDHAIMLAGLSLNSTGAVSS